VGAGGPDLGTGTTKRRGSVEIASHYATALGRGLHSFRFDFSST